MTTHLRAVSAAVTLLAVALLSGCVSMVTPGDTQTEEQTVEPQGAESAQVAVAMGAGSLNISGGADNLMDAEFTYNIEQWQPEVSYTVNGGRGELSVSQPDNMSVPNNDVQYSWDVKLTNDLPLTLDVTLGAGESNLDLSELDLEGLSVQTGAGESIVILTGDYSRSFDVSMEGGVGTATLLFNNSVGVQVEVSGGLGSIRAPGFTQDGTTYTNDAYGSADTTLNVSIEGGVGEIQLQLVD